MVNEIDIVFALLRSALGGNQGGERLDPQRSTLSSKEWWHLFRLMQQNHVAALTAEVLPTGMPREVLLPWLAEGDKAVRWHRYQQEVQQEIVDIMAHHGIETLVLKGTNTARHYPTPQLREFKDLDLYFYDKHDDADRVAREVLKVEVSNDAHHHSKYNYRGVTVESHYNFLNTHYPPSNRRYEALLKELISTSDSNSSFFTHHSSFEVLFLLRHMACHFAASRITLRDLVDWTLTCRTLADKVDWQLVKKAIEDFGMTDFVAALNTIATQHLGVSMSQCLAVLQSCSLDVSLVHKVEHDLVYGSEEADNKADGLERLGWKLRRWRALAWKRRMVFNDSPLRLLLTSLTSHIEKPQSILHKQ